MKNTVCKIPIPKGVEVEKYSGYRKEKI